MSVEDISSMRELNEAEQVGEEICIPADEIESVEKSLQRIASLPDVPEPAKVELKKIQTQLEYRAHVQQYSGPIPPPELLAAFEKVVPGLASKIVQWKEDESNHRRQLELTELEGNIKLKNRRFDEKKRGQVLGFWIGTIAIISGTISIIFDHPLAGSFMGGGGVVSLVSAFLYSKRESIPAKKQETAEDNEEEN